MNHRSFIRSCRKDRAEKKLPGALDGCALCGAPATVSGVFIPNPIQQHLYGAPAGKLRHFVYGLCARCVARGPVIIPEIEQAAMDDYGKPIWN